jgi:hypothetical protein
LDSRLRAKTVDWVRKDEKEACNIYGVETGIRMDERLRV